MLKLKYVRRKNAPYLNKWEGETYEGHYVIIRIKDECLDVRIAPSYESFVCSGCRTIFRADSSIPNNILIETEEILKYLDITVDEIK